MTGTIFGAFLRRGKYAANKFAITLNAQCFTIFCRGSSFIYCTRYFYHQTKALVRMFKFLFFTTTLFVFVNASAQKFEKVKRSDVTAADFESNVSSIDTSADAVVLLDQGSTNFISNKANWFSNVYKRFVRIKVLKHPGVNAATHEIVLYKNDKDDREVLSDVKGTTYNLENGKLVSTALDAGSIFEDQLNKNHTAKKFTLPAVKEGSIIDLSYTITSPFNFNLRSWFFQNTWYPTLESDYQVAIPGTLNYVMKKNGLDSFAATSKWETRESFMFNELNASTQVNYFHWNMKNIPALKIESFISAASNYADKLEFQLASTYNGESTQDIAGDWTKTADFLLQSPDFGEAITEQVNIPALDNIMDPNTDKLSKAKQIFYYIKSNFSCTSHNYFFVQTNLQNVVKKARGNVGEINLLLINKLRQYNISAEPVIVSTRANGFAYTKYPMVSNFNYLVCKVYIDDHLYYLDASQPLLGFGKITTDCYNDIAVEIIKNPETVLLSADSLKETRQTTVFVFNADKGMEGSYVSNESDASSYEIREQLLTTSQ